MKIKAFIFDLDGVIVDTAKFHFIAWQRLAASLGIAFNEEQNEQLKGVSRVDSLKKILDWGNRNIGPEVFEAKMRQKNEEYLDLIATLNTSDILPGVHDFLKRLKKDNLPIALGSASKNARPLLHKLCITHFFDVVVDGTNVSQAKPDPEVFTNAADQLGIPHSDCIVFEDSTAGIQAANAAGMYSVGLGSPEILNQAKEVFPTFNKMPEDYINQLLKK